MNGPLEGVGAKYGIVVDSGTAEQPSAAPPEKDQGIPGLKNAQYREGASGIFQGIWYGLMALVGHPKLGNPPVRGTYETEEAFKGSQLTWKNELQTGVKGLKPREKRDIEGPSERPALTFWGRMKAFFGGGRL